MKNRILIEKTEWDAPWELMPAHEDNYRYIRAEWRTSRREQYFTESRNVRGCGAILDVTTVLTIAFYGPAKHFVPDVPEKVLAFVSCTGQYPNMPCVKIVQEISEDRQDFFESTWPPKDMQHDH